MTAGRILRRCLKSLGDFLNPGYRPECHYMRGPGPACLRRAGAGPLTR